MDGRQKGAIVLTKTGLVIQVIVREMKIFVDLSIIKLHSDSVMSILVNGPNKARQIQAFSQY